VRTLAGHSDRVNSVAISADGKRVVSGSSDKTVKIWDVETGAEVTGVCGLVNAFRGMCRRRDLVAGRDISPEYFQILLCTNQTALRIHFQGALGGEIGSRSQGFKFLGSGLRFWGSFVPEYSGRGNWGMADGLGFRATSE